MHSMKRLWTVLSLAFFLVLAIGTNSAYAHAGMMGSTPKDGEVLQANPGQISMRFTETLEPDLVTVRLFDWDGKEIQMQTDLAAGRCFAGECAVAGGFGGRDVLGDRGGRIRRRPSG